MMKPYQQRVVSERGELGEKFFKLLALFQTDTFSGLSEAEKSRLCKQAEFMDLYSSVLEERIAAFD